MVYYFLATLFLISGYFAVRQKLAPLTIEQLLELEESGQDISEENYQTFTEVEWFKAREDKFRQDYEYKILQFFANTGRLLTIEEAKTVFKYKSEPVFFKNLEHYFPRLQPDTIYMAMILYYLNKKEVKPKRVIPPALRDEETKKDFIYVYPGMDFDIFPIEQLRQDERFLSGTTSKPYSATEEQ